MAPNPAFLEQVAKEFPDGGRVIIGCKSGRRSAAAAAALGDKFEEIVDVAGGFDAWIAAGLPVAK
jgi:rhodanese-related sulfurtransferase